MPRARARSRTAGAASACGAVEGDAEDVGAAAGDGGGGTRSGVGGLVAAGGGGVGTSGDGGGAATGTEGGGTAAAARRRLRRRFLGRLAAVVDADQHRPHRHHLPDRAAEFDHAAGHRRGHFDRGLVGHHVAQRLVLGDAVADLDAPLDDLDFGDAFADVRHADDRDAHVPYLPSPCDRPRPPASAPESTPTPAHADTACPSRSRARSALRGGRSSAPAPARSARRRSRWCAWPRAARRSGRSSSPTPPWSSQVQRPQAAQVDHLGVDAGLARGGLGHVAPSCRRSARSGRRRAAPPRPIPSGTV